MVCSMSGRLVSTWMAWLIIAPAVRLSTLSFISLIPMYAHIKLRCRFKNPF